MNLQDHIPLAGKTTMRIGGTARYFADLTSTQEAEEAWAFAIDKDIPLIVLGNGSNSIFHDGEIRALVVRIKAEKVEIDGNDVTVQTGKNLPMLINELAAKDLDLSPLTGIPGTVGGALFGNAGQGPAGIWIDHYVTSVTAYIEGQWKTFSKADCDFAYRGSVFKHGPDHNPILWEATLSVPTRAHAAVRADIEALLQKRIETQPHVKTAGSCFKAVGETPAWKLIDAAGLRGHQIGGVQIAEKHANFLLNTGSATYEDAKQIVELVQKTVSEPLDVEMRFFEEDGSLEF